jgi:D-alanyl-D-alanine carboxypeptidase
VSEDNIHLRILSGGGLYNYTDAPEISASLDEDPTKVWTPDEVLTIAFKRPLYFPPDWAYHYTNTNYALLGLIAEEREHGKPLTSPVSGGRNLRTARPLSDF